MSNHLSLTDDVIWGVDGEHGIAAELGISASRAYYLISKGAIPVKRLGHRTITASRSELRRHFAGSVSQRYRSCLAVGRLVARAMLDQHTFTEDINNGNVRRVARDGRFASDCEDGGPGSEER
jgi:hypothetical protein